MRIGYRAVTIDKPKSAPARPKARLSDILQRWKPRATLLGPLDAQVDDLIAELRSGPLSPRPRLQQKKGEALVAAFLLRGWLEVINDGRPRRAAEDFLGRAMVLDATDVAPVIDDLKRVYETGVLTKDAVRSAIRSACERLQRVLPLESRVVFCSEVMEKFELNTWGIGSTDSAFTPSNLAPLPAASGSPAIDDWKNTRRGRAMTKALGRAKPFQSGYRWASFTMKDPRFGFGIRPPVGISIGLTDGPQPQPTVHCFLNTTTRFGEKVIVSANAIPAMLRLIHESLQRSDDRPTLGDLHRLVRDLAALGGLTPTVAEIENASFDPLLDELKKFWELPE